MILNPTLTAHHFRKGVMKLFATFTVVTILAIPASAEEILFNPAVTVGDIDEFAISPDGTRVVMVGDLIDNGVFEDQTWVAGLLGGGVFNPATRVDPAGLFDNDGGVAWSPNGLSVTVRYDPSLTVNGNVNELYLVPADGSKTAQQLTFGSTNAFDPQISNDGTRFYFSDETTPGFGSLYVTPIAGASAATRILLNPGGISEIDTGTYAKVGSDILFSGFSNPVPGATNEDAFYRTAGDGSTAGSPTLINVNNFTSGADIDFVGVTPDQQSIIFLGNLTDLLKNELYSMPITGGAATKLIFGTLPTDSNVNSFKISPDGQTIAFVSDILTDGVAELFVLPTTGGTPIRVSNSSGFTQANGFDVDFGGVDTIQFSPDSSSIYYLSDGGGGADGTVGGINGTFRLFRVPNLIAVPEPAALPLLFAASAFFLRRKRS